MFNSAGDVTALNIAKWDGTEWSALQGGVSRAVLALASTEGGTDPALFVSLSGSADPYNSPIMRWTGNWTKLTCGFNGSVYSLVSHNEDGSPVVFAGGGFTEANCVLANRIARWDGKSWSAVGDGVNGTVFALAVYDDGTGPAIYAGGGFTSAGGTAASNIARWDGTSWMPLGDGLNGLVFALATYDDGTGPALYAGGIFTTAGGIAASNIARWDGKSWSALASGLNGAVRALAILGDGPSSTLYAGGSFTASGTLATSRIAQWNRGKWDTVGGGLGSGTVFTLLPHDDGAGRALYVGGGGFVSAGDVPVRLIARWDGVAWSSADAGLSSGGICFTLGVFRRESTTLLVAGGTFHQDNGWEGGLRNIAGWDGTEWTYFGAWSTSSGIGNRPRALIECDGQAGPELLVGGDFYQVQFQPLVSYDFLMKWGCTDR